MGHELQTKASVVASRQTKTFEAPPELRRELVEAIAEIERGQCVELSPEQLERCIVDGEWPWPDESPRLSATLKRGLLKLDIAPRSARFRAVFATVDALANTEVLPAPIDSETVFAPRRAHVRRVPGQNLWVLFRFDATHVDVLAVRGAPPVPFEESE